MLTEEQRLSDQTASAVGKGLGHFQVADTGEVSLLGEGKWRVREIYAALKEAEYVIEKLQDLLQT